ncbi:hypothetical protein [Ruegeria meonggei]|uniref:Lipoprotein n=1 Tax=Ruegeria meonggei TaxID=1446476 RepID=A0A1X6YDP4_9RHOB|nr:hypothetical protein [Ruegeria meonggei]SLN18157.1 hypothetical protein RUM8411_00578 [Ruegeria meonggei]
MLVRNKQAPSKARRTAVLCAVVLLSAVSACGLVTPSDDRILFDGKAFRAKAKPVDKKASPADFTVVVKGASASLDGAREAGRYEGIKFCIASFGSSRIEWKVGPDTDPQNLRITDDNLTFAGTCQRP